MFRGPRSYFGVPLVTLLGLMGLVAIGGKDSDSVLSPIAEKLDDAKEAVKRTAEAIENSATSEKAKAWIAQGTAVLKDLTSDDAPPAPKHSTSSPRTTPPDSFEPAVVPSALPNATFAPRAETPVAGGDIQVYFSPKGGCTAAIVKQVQQARRSILVQAYSFTSTPIAKALGEARAKGVEVHVILDKSQETGQYSAADYLIHHDIDTSIDDQHKIAHNKIILIDGETILTGSFNFSAQAEDSNAENLLVIHGRTDLYSSYYENFRHHYEHSRAYSERGPSQRASRKGNVASSPTLTPNRN